MVEVSTSKTGKHGRTPVGWDDEVDAGVALPRGQLVMSWHGDHDERVALASLRQGHDVVMTPQESLYFDHRQTGHPDEWAGPPPEVTLRAAYDTQLVPPGATTDEAKHIVGVQAGLWAEQLLTFAHTQHATYPRLAALAELGWSPAAAHGWDGFMARLPAQIARYRALGIGMADTAFAPVFDTTLEADGYRVAIDSQVHGFDIRYTIDGSAPSAASLVYAQPITLAAGKTLKAATFASDGTLLASARALVLDDATTWRRDSATLRTCSGEPPSRLEGAKPRAGSSKVYAVEIGNACWLWPDAAVQGAAHVTVTAEELPWRYGDESRGAVVHEAHGAAGGFEIHAGGCDGPRLATLPFKPGTQAPGPVKLEAALAAPVAAGAHALCIFATGDPRKGQWALGTISFSK